MAERPGNRVRVFALFGFVFLVVGAAVQLAIPDDRYVLYDCGTVEVRGLYLDDRVVGEPELRYPGGEWGRWEQPSAHVHSACNESSRWRA